MISPAVTTPLLVTSNGRAISSITTYPDGRQNLTVTAANNPYLIHSLLLSYGNINWVTKGAFLGERHVYLNPQNDDILIDDDIWDTKTLTDTTGLTYRMKGTDLTALVTWQNKLEIFPHDPQRDRNGMGLCRRGRTTGRLRQRHADAGGDRQSGPVPVGQSHVHPSEPGLPGHGGGDSG